MRGRLVEAAVRLLAEQGPAAVQARRLAQQVGASTMAVYHYFGGMPQLLGAVIEEGFRRLDTRLTAVPVTDDPVTNLGRLALAYRAAARKNPHLYDLMFGLSSPGGHRPEDAPSATSEQSVSQRAYGHLVDASERAIRAGRIRNQDPAHVAAQLWSTLHGYVTLELAGHPRSRPRRHRPGGRRLHRRRAMTEAPGSRSGTARHLRPVPDEAATSTPGGVAMAEALASFLSHLASRRGRSGRITSPETLRSYTSALPKAFAGIDHLAALDGGGRDRLHANIHTAWGSAQPSTFNAKRAAVASALAYFAAQDWITDAAAVLAGLDRQPQPKPTDEKVRTREAIDRLIADKRHPLEDRTLWAMLYATAARAEEVLRLNIENLDRANRRAHTIRKGGKQDQLLYDGRTARMLGQLLGRRRTGPIFLSTRTAPDGTARTGTFDPASRRLRMTYRTAERHIGTATGGWDLHDLRHSRLTHAGEDGATEADLMNLSGHEDRRTLQRYLNPSKEGTHQRLDDIDNRRHTWTPGADELTDRLARASSQTTRSAH
ncbi:hypothetical protein GCM10012275_50710 [Longimycelium tulufanense]|uniref:Uncharacterized protein n=1 Tax=Longimycelium tulufanense TaxID=907463 RepID=A0A8J3CGY9_9PSEU|nr:WHG domain-containing protein [Longimycelium tulufanense]GGM73876.1 hypothetical protein GCM10012275_50710 [Longimycelium tulufanense]